MVHAVILHTLLPGTCRVLYSRIYGEKRTEPTGCTHSTTGEVGVAQSGTEKKESALRTERKERLLLVANEVHAEYALRQATSTRSYENDYQSLVNEGRLPEFEVGVFRVAPGDLGFQCEKTVVWMGAMNIGFVLVCEKHENRILAEMILKLLIKYVQDYCQLLIQVTDALLKADRVAMVIDQFLPAGQLLPMNHRMIRQFERELEMKMKT